MGTDEVMRLSNAAACACTRVNPTPAAVATENRTSVIRSSLGDFGMRCCSPPQLAVKRMLLPPRSAGGTEQKPDYDRGTSSECANPKYLPVLHCTSTWKLEGITH